MWDENWNVIWHRCIQLVRPFSSEKVFTMPPSLPYCKCPVTTITAPLCYQACQLSPVAELLTLPLGQLLTHAVLNAWVWVILQSCGLEANIFTGYSFRCGAATTMFKAVLSGEIIQLLCDWRSDAYKLYLNVDLDSIFTFLSPWLNFLKQNQNTNS